MDIFQPPNFAPDTQKGFFDKKCQPDDKICNARPRLAHPAAESGASGFVLSVGKIEFSLFRFVDSRTNFALSFFYCHRVGMFHPQMHR